jgi:ArsR family transcriptional regulator
MCPKLFLAYFADLRNTSAMPSPRPPAADRRKQRAAVFKALGHPARLAIVEELAGGERCVCDLVDLVGLGWSAVSRHLTVLKAAGVLADEKRGQQVFYRLALPCVRSFTTCLEAAHSGRGGCA